MSVMTTAGAQAEDQQSLRKKLKTLMSRYNVGSRFANIPLQKASILLPVVIKEGRLHTILTVRSMKLSVMPGQVCFPGGRQDPGDQDYVETALRESREEIGLCPNQVEVIGNFVPCISMPPAVYVVTPVVGIVEDTFQPTSNPKEVTDVLCIPLEFFLSRDHCTVRELHVKPIGSYLDYLYVYQDKETEKTFHIWGLTAHSALLMSIMLLEKSPEFAPEFDLDSRIQACEKHILACVQSKL